MSIVLIVLVMLVEAGKIAARAYLILHPIQHPLTSSIATSLSIRSYLVVINVHLPLKDTPYGQSGPRGLRVSGSCRSPEPLGMSGRGLALRLLK